MTVGELIKILRNFDERREVVVFQGTVVAYEYEVDGVIDDGERILIDTGGQLSMNPSQG